MMYDGTFQIFALSQERDNKELKFKVISARP